MININVLSWQKVTGEMLHALRMTLFDTFVNDLEKSVNSNLMKSADNTKMGGSYPVITL